MPVASCHLAVIPFRFPFPDPVIQIPRMIQHPFRTREQECHSFICGMKGIQLCLTGQSISSIKIHSHNRQISSVSFCIRILFPGNVLRKNRCHLLHPHFLQQSKYLRIVMIRMPVAGKYKNGLFTVKLWQFLPIIIKQIITPPGFHQKAAVVNV